MWFISAWNRHWTKCWIILLLFTFRFSDLYFKELLLLYFNFSEIGLCFTKLDNCIWVYIFIYLFTTLRHCYLVSCTAYSAVVCKCVGGSHAFPFSHFISCTCFVPGHWVLCHQIPINPLFISLSSGFHLWAFTLPSPPIMLSARSLRVEVCDIS